MQLHLATLTSVLLLVASTRSAPLSNDSSPAISLPSPTLSFRPKHSPTQKDGTTNFEHSPTPEERTASFEHQVNELTPLQITPLPNPLSKDSINKRLDDLGRRIGYLESIARPRQLRPEPKPRPQPRSRPSFNDDADVPLSSPVLDRGSSRTSSRTSTTDFGQQTEITDDGISVDHSSTQQPDKVNPMSSLAPDSSDDQNLDPLGTLEGVTDISLGAAKVNNNGRGIVKKKST